MKKLSVLLLGILLTAQAAFAEDWFERDMKHLGDDIKMEVLKLYNDFHQTASKTRAEIILSSNKLAQAIENKATEAEQSKLVQTITNEVVTLGDETRMTYNVISSKIGSASKKFTKEFYDDDDEDDFYNEIFTADGVQDIYDLLRDAGITTPTKKEIRAIYGEKIKAADDKLAAAYIKYRGFWMAGITSGTEFDKVKKAYAEAIKNEINLAASVYASEVMKLNKKQLGALSSERERMTKKELNDINEKAMHVSVKIQSKLNSLGK